MFVSGRDLRSLCASDRFAWDEVACAVIYVGHADGVLEEARYFSSNVLPKEVVRVQEKWLVANIYSSSECVKSYCTIAGERSSRAWLGAPSYHWKPMPRVGLSYKTDVCAYTLLQLLKHCHVSKFTLGCAAAASIPLMDTTVQRTVLAGVELSHDVDLLTYLGMSR